MRESYDQVVLLGGAKVRPFLNLQRLVKSPLFCEALTYAIGHHVKFGDSRFIVELVKLYYHQTTKRLLTGHIRDHAGLHVSIEDGQVKLAKVVQLTERSAATTAPKRAKKPAPPPVVVTVKKKRKNPKRVDLMAPWIRLPGHYGAKGR